MKLLIASYLRKYASMMLGTALPGGNLSTLRDRLKGNGAVTVIQRIAPESIKSFVSWVLNPNSYITLEELQKRMTLIRVELKKIQNSELQNNLRYLVAAPLQSLFNPNVPYDVSKRNEILSYYKEMIQKENDSLSKARKTNIDVRPEKGWGSDIVLASPTIYE